MANQPIIESSKESEKKAKYITVRVVTTVRVKDSFDSLLGKCKLYKALRVSPWVSRFINKCCKVKKGGPLIRKIIKH